MIIERFNIGDRLRPYRRWGPRPVVTGIFLIASVILSSCGGSARMKHFVAEAREAIISADAAMGDWKGTWKSSDPTETGPLVAQVIALGNGQYRANFLEMFDARIEPYCVLDGKRHGAVVRFEGPAKCEDKNLDVKAVIEGDKLTGTFSGDASGTFSLRRAIRVSPTMGARPPKGAVVLFDGKDFREWKIAKKPPGQDEVKWEIVDGAMRVVPGTGSIITKKNFGDAKLHIEFRTPFMPEARGQGRGNSGVYLQGRYEVQVLDSYGLEGKNNECGGIYGVKAPRVNMCAPPGQWQTYDIIFRAPRFDKAGKKTSNATLTVRHNGVLIHDKTEVPAATRASLSGEAPEPGPLYLQNHGNKVEYRNIWLVEQ